MNGDTVRCAICGALLKRAGTHYVRAHQITAADYRKLYGVESTPCPERCPFGHSMEDAITMASGYRQCRTCKQIEEANRLATDAAYAERKRAKDRAYHSRPEIRARIHERQQTPEYKARNAERQRARRAAKRTGGDS